MIEKERRIRFDIYSRAEMHGGRLKRDDYREVFTPQELFGYGVYSPRVFERDGKYYVRFSMGDSCD